MPDIIQSAALARFLRNRPALPLRTARTGLRAHEQGPLTATAGGCTEEVGDFREGGWRPAVLGTGGIQEDRMPGASDSIHALAGATSKPIVLQIIVIDS